MERETDGTQTSILGSKKRKRKLYTCLRTMIKYTMLLSVIYLIMLCCKNGQSFHEKQSTKPADLPGKFFPRHSHVIDYQFGGLQPVIKLLEDEELICIMYYAPWCAECMQVRGQFLMAAKTLSNTVKFVAINCWYTEGECRKRMSFTSYPQIYVYHTGVAEGYRFAGIKEAEYMVKFVESFLFPLHPLHTETQIQQFAAQQDNTVIGYFDFNSSPQPPGTAFHQFYLTALRVTSYEFYQPVKFGVVQTQRLGRHLDLNSSNRFVLLRTGNTTLKYPLFFNMTSKNMTNWIFYYKQKNMAQWLVPPGVKSVTLSPHLQEGPAVLVFAPVNPLLNFNPYLNMVRLMSYAYNSCGNFTEKYQDIMKKIIYDTNNQIYEARKVLRQCKEKLTNNFASEVVPLYDSKCCISLLGSRNFNQRNICEYCVQNSKNYQNQVCDINLGSEVKMSDWNSVLVNSCSDFYRFYNINEHRSVCCQGNKASVPIKMVPGSKSQGTRRATDPFVISGANTLFKQKCSKLTLQKLKHLINLEELSKNLVVTKPSDIHAQNITGLQCRTNRTVKFYLVDSVYHSLFVERLGVPVSRHHNNNTSVIITDVKDEAVFVFREKLNYANLGLFVMNYTRGSLPRHLRSQEMSSPSHCDSQSTVCIVDVSSHTFQQLVMDNAKDVVLLYYSTWCGFCAKFSQVYLALAQYFKSSQNIVFSRIEADRNDLPWEFTVDTYPTVIYFPAHRKSESVMFPEHLPKTLPYLVKFILHYSNESLQLDTAISMCSKDCIAKNIARLLPEIARLEIIVGQLRRKAQTLTTQQGSDVKTEGYIQTVNEALSKAHDLRHYKLRKAQMLNYYLQNNLKALDKKMFLSFMESR